MDKPEPTTQISGIVVDEVVGLLDDEKAEEPWTFQDSTTYHIIPHPLNPGRKNKRGETKPGLSVLYQTVPLSQIPKEIQKAAQDPLPKFLRKLFRKPEPDWEKHEQAVRVMEAARGRMIGVYKPKREGNPFIFWKKRPPAAKCRKICRGLKQECTDEGSVYNISTFKKNKYNIVLGNFGKVDLEHESIWKPRSPIRFSIGDIRLEWKGTKQIRHPTGKEKALWMMHLAHLKLVAYPPPPEDSEDGNADKSPEGIILAEYIRLAAITKLARLRVDWNAVASVFGENKEEELETLLISSCTVAHVIERKRRQKLRFIIDLLIEVADNAGG